MRRYTPEINIPAPPYCRISALLKCDDSTLRRHLVADINEHHELPPSEQATKKALSVAMDKPPFR